MRGGRNINPRWRRCAPANCRSQSSMCCTGTIWSISCRISDWPISEATRRELVLAWHKLDVWPDVKRGLGIMHQHALLAPVSNGNISLMAALARRNDLRWDAILGAEVAGDYKPKPRVYFAACEAFDLDPSQCMMVAAHSADLAAASACRLQTGFVARPDEKGPGKGESAPTVPVDAQGSDLVELAQRIFD